MRQVTATELRRRPAAVLAALTQEGRILITRRGRPTAMLVTPQLARLLRGGSGDKDGLPQR